MVEYYLKTKSLEYDMAGLSAGDIIRFLRLVSLSAGMPCPGVLCTEKGKMSNSEIFRILDEEVFYNAAMEGHLSYILSHGGMVVYINDIRRYIHFPRKIRTLSEGIYVLRKELGWMSGDPIMEILKSVWGEEIPIAMPKKNISNEDLREASAFMGEDRVALVESYLDRFRTVAMMSRGQSIAKSKALKLLEELKSMYTHLKVTYRGTDYAISEERFIKALNLVAHKDELQGLSNHNYLKVVLLNGHMKKGQQTTIEGY